MLWSHLAGRLPDTPNTLSFFLHADARQARARCHRNASHADRVAGLLTSRLEANRPFLARPLAPRYRKGHIAQLAVAGAQEDMPFRPLIPTGAVDDENLLRVWQLVDLISCLDDTSVIAKQNVSRTSLLHFEKSNHGLQLLCIGYRLCHPWAFTRIINEIRTAHKHPNLTLFTGLLVLSRAAGPVGVGIR